MREEAQAQAGSAGFSLPFLVKARHNALFDLSPLPVLGGLCLSQLQKKKKKKKQTPIGSTSRY